MCNKVTSIRKYFQTKKAVMAQQSTSVTSNAFELHNTTSANKEGLYDISPANWLNNITLSLLRSSSIFSSNSLYINYLIHIVEYPAAY
jgi:hypothetical protein